MAVSAAGSPLGQSIYKALRTSNLDIDIYMTDISHTAAGFFLNKKEKNTILPLVNSKEYKEAFFSFLQEKNIQVFFPTITQDYVFIDNYRDEIKKIGVLIGGAGYSTYELCNDKFFCFEKLRIGGIKIPKTFLVNHSEIHHLKLEFPVILKPRFGASSNDIFKVESMEKLTALLLCFPEGYFIGQEYMSDLDEYTIGVYRSLDKSIERAFVIKRELKFGLSYKGEVLDSNEIANYALEVCRTLGTEFSANVQLKIHNGEPYAFEVNPRLSSTTSVRAKFGFNEPELIIRDLFNDLDNYNWDMKKGSFMRYWEEVYLEE